MLREEGKYIYIYIIFYYFVSSIISQMFYVSTFFYDFLCLTRKLHLCKYANFLTYMASKGSINIRAWFNSEFRNSIETFLPFGTTHLKGLKIVK